MTRHRPCDTRARPSRAPPRSTPSRTLGCHTASASAQPSFRESGRSSRSSCAPRGRGAPGPRRRAGSAGRSRIFTWPLATTANSSSAIACIASRVAMCVNERLPRHVQRALRRRATPGANGGTDARGVAEARHQAERAQAVERLVPGVLADRVVDHLDALAAGDLLDPRGEVLAAVVDREGGAVVARQRAFLVAAGGADQLQAERLRPLAGDQADAAGRGVEER